MPGRSFNHAKRSPGIVESNRIAVLDNGKLDRDWFDDCSLQSPAIAPALWPRSGYRNRRGAIQPVTRHVTG